MSDSLISYFRDRAVQAERKRDEARAALYAERERTTKLREALEPFAKIRSGIDDTECQGEWFRYDGDVLMTEDFHRARAVLAETGGE
jgi:hypothetical protein